MYEEWRTLTVSGLSDAILRLQNDRRRKQVADLFQLQVAATRDELESRLHGLVECSMNPAFFDVRSACLRVAQLDAYRTAASDHPGDFRALTDIQDWLFPLCIHPTVKSIVALGMNDRQGAIIRESVALAVGAELAAAQADGRRSGFRLDDEGKVVGNGLLRLVDTPIGDPDPRIVIEEILKDLADQLCIMLSADESSRVDERIRQLTRQIRFSSPSNASNTRFYCVIPPQKSAAATDLLRQALSGIRKLIPQFVFFELYRGQSKAAEEVIFKIVKDRLQSV